MTEFLPSFNFNLDTILKTNDINKSTQTHLAKVYAALGSGILFSSVSGFIANNGYLPISLISTLFIGLVIAEIVLVFMPRGSKIANTYMKPLTFYAWTLCTGGMLGNLFFYVNPNEKKLLAQTTASAFIYALAIFSTFSVFSLLTVRRSQIFFGSIVTSLILSIASIFVFNMFLESLIGLVIGILYVIIDTQLIIFKTENGVFDVFTDAKQLFIDFVKIFIEILKILSKESDKKSKK